MTAFTFTVIALMTVISFCEGFNMKILMDRLDNIESRLEIRRQEIAIVYEKISVIDSLEAKVKMLIDGKETDAKSISIENKDILQIKEKTVNIRDFKNVMFDAFRREKIRNEMMHDDYKQFKDEMKMSLKNQTRDQTLTFNDKLERVSDDMNKLNSTLIDLKASTENVQIQANQNTGIGQRLFNSLENITFLQYDIESKVEQLQNKNEVVSKKQDLIWNITYKADSCTTLKMLGLGSGIFQLRNSNLRTNIRAYCDQETDGGGWIVFQRRKDGSVDFNKKWNDYKLGFGDLNGEFWLGNEYLNVLTSDGTYELRIDMENFDGNKAYAKYSRFKIHTESDNYRLEVSGYSGNAGDSLAFHKNASFSTNDNYNDKNDYCKRFNSGWWFNNCFYANLNGKYYQRKQPSSNLGIHWYHWLSDTSSLKFTEMKFRKT